MIMLPIAVYYGYDAGMEYVPALAVDPVIQAFVDNLKANRLFINLIIYQSIHPIQIGLTAAVLLA